MCVWLLCFISCCIIRIATTLTWPTRSRRMNTLRNQNFKETVQYYIWLKCFMNTVTFSFKAAFHVYLAKKRRNHIRHRDFCPVSTCVARSPRKWCFRASGWCFPRQISPVLQYQVETSLFQRVYKRLAEWHNNLVACGKPLRFCTCYTLEDDRSAWTKTKICNLNWAMSILCKDNRKTENPITKL